MEKRGQVTVFIIIGMAIVIAIVALFYVRNVVTQSALQKEATKIGTVPQQIIPVRDFINTCVEETARDGINLLEGQGGYIELPQDNLPSTVINPFSSNLELFSNSNQEVPYWFYETSNGIQKNQIPSKELMEQQLSNYVTNNLEFCLSNISFYQSIGYDFNYKGIVRTTTKINNENVEVLVDYPVEVSLKDVSKLLDKHYAAIDSKLGKLYDTARNIMETQNRDNFFEERTIDMMSVYDEIPFSGSDFSCTKKIWSKTKVQQDFRKIVARNVAAVKLRSLSTNDKYFVLGNLNSNVNTNFIYSEDWPFYMEVRPSNGDILTGDEIIKTSGVTGFLSSILCLNNYNFVYDVKYPVLVSLNEDNEVFQFAFEVIIKDNQPKQNNIPNTEYNLVNVDICDKGSNEITVIALDEDLRAVEDARVTYKCFTSSCDIGLTKLNNLEEATVTKIFPPCLNGLVTAEKDGYYKAEELMDSNHEQQQILTLQKLYDKDVEIKIIDKEIGSLRVPYSNEQVVFRLTNLDNDFIATLNYPEDSKIQLISGSYKVESYLINDKSFTIPSQTVRNCVKVPKPGVLGLFLKEEKCVTGTIDSSTLDSSVTGGVNFEFEITKEDLEKSSKIILYTMFDKTPLNYDDLNEIQNSIEVNDANENFRLPKFE